MDDDTLDRECSVFCRYLIGQEPNEYVKQKYRAAHRSNSARENPENPAEVFLVKVAASSSWSTKIIDAYTRVFRPVSTVRKKLVLLLAILESCAPSHAYLESVDSNSISFLFVRFLQQTVTFGLVLLLGMLFIFPAELILRVHVKHIACWLPRNG